jgi:hypothetical protein
MLNIQISPRWLTTVYVRVGCLASDTNRAEVDLRRYDRLDGLNPMTSLIRSKVWKVSWMCWLKLRTSMAFSLATASTKTPQGVQSSKSVARAEIGPASGRYPSKIALSTIATFTWSVAAAGWSLMDRP